MSVPGFGSTFRNCFDLASLERGHNRDPEPPESKIIFISVSISRLEAEVSAFCLHGVIKEISVGELYAISELSGISPPEGFSLAYIQELARSAVRA